MPFGSFATWFARVRARWARAFGLLLCAALIVCVPFVVIGELPGERWLSAYDDRALPFGVAGALLLACDVLLPIPSSVVGVMLGARLGWLWGALCATVGLTLGHCAGYWLGRLAPERWSRPLPVAPSVLGVLATRPVPVLAEAVVLAAGAARLPWWPFAGALLIGDALYGAALAASGAAGFASGHEWAVLIAPLGFGLLAWWGARRWLSARPPR